MIKVCFITVTKRSVAYLGSFWAFGIKPSLYLVKYCISTSGKHGGSGLNNQFSLQQKEFQFSVIFLSFVLKEANRLQHSSGWSVLLFLAVIRLLWCAWLFIWITLPVIHLKIRYHFYYSLHILLFCRRSFEKFSKASKEFITEVGAEEDEGALLDLVPC